MNFYIDHNTFNNYGVPIYRLLEQSFDFEPYIASNLSIMLGSSCVSLEMNLDDNKILYLSGFCPMRNWKRGKITLPVYDKGTLLMEKCRTHIPGIGIELENKFVTIYDKKSKWVCFYSNSELKDCEYVMFANDTIAAITNKKLVAVWIKPRFI